MEYRSRINFSFTRRGFVRLVSFLTALVATLGAAAAVGYARADRYRVTVEENYAQALTGLASNLSGIAATLQKARYASTPTQSALLAARLWRDASAAKTSLAGLPISGLHLDNTNRFLSQIGDYAMALSRKAVNGAAISAQERASFERLCRYGQNMADRLYRVEQTMVANQISMESLQQEIAALGADGADDPSDTLIAFQALEESFDDYPELNYDGMFSDHIAGLQPQMLRGAKTVTQDEARRVAAAAAGADTDALQDGPDEASSLPAHTFTSDGVWAAVTKQGGHLLYLIRSRATGEQSLEPYAAVDAARGYLRERGLPSMIPTYYEIDQGVCVVTFAAQQGDVALYPDRVRVEVALDNGEILAYDARPYLMNHQTRVLPAPTLSLAEAKALAGQGLTVENSRLVVIPTAGQGETYCYELLCVSSDGTRLLAYINAANGQEEDLALLPASGGVVLFGYN